MMASWKVSRLNTLMKQDFVCPQALGITVAPSSSCQGTSDPTLLSPVMSSQRPPYSPLSSTALAFPASSLPCPAISSAGSSSHPSLHTLVAVGKATAVLASPISLYTTPQVISSRQIGLNAFYMLLTSQNIICSRPLPRPQMNSQLPIHHLHLDVK